jgi:hypothetical protein
LQSKGFDLDLIGFDDEELARLLAAPDAMRRPMFTIPENMTESLLSRE